MVEDHADTLLVLHYMLENGGFAVIEAANGEAAWRMLRIRRPDLILTDLMIPEMGWS